MSSMRSASSSTTYSTWLSTAFLASIWSSRRPGVATRTSTPFSSDGLGLHVDAAEHHGAAQVGVFAKQLDLLGHLVGQLRVGSSTSARTGWRAGDVDAFRAEQTVQQRQCRRCLAGARLGRAITSLPVSPPEWLAPGWASWSRSPSRRWRVERLGQGRLAYSGADGAAFSAGVAAAEWGNGFVHAQWVVTTGLGVLSVR